MRTCVCPPVPICYKICSLRCFKHGYVTLQAHLPCQRYSQRERERGGWGRKRGFMSESSWLKYEVAQIHECAHTITHLTWAQSCRGHTPTHTKSAMQHSPPTHTLMQLSSTPLLAVSFLLFLSTLLYDVALFKTHTLVFQVSPKFGTIHYTFYK